jgi:hypothetical protein
MESQERSAKRSRSAETVGSDPITFSAPVQFRISMLEIYAPGAIHGSEVASWVTL